jgi:hypothetical protein
VGGGGVKLEASGHDLLTDIMVAVTKCISSILRTRMAAVAFPPTREECYKNKTTIKYQYTSTALYFYEAYKKSLHKPRAIFGNMLFKISYGFN